MEHSRGPTLRRRHTGCEESIDDVIMRLSAPTQEVKDRLRERVKNIDSVFREIEDTMGSRCMTVYEDKSVDDIIQELTMLLQNSLYYS